MTGSGGARAARRTIGRRLTAWALVAVAALAVLGTVRPQPERTPEVRLVAASAPVLSPEEQQLVALMDPSDRARYLLQRRIAEKAEAAALLSAVQRARHETAMSVIGSIR
jgi:hypothetical protein